MDVEVEPPHVHHHAGHGWLDKILPVSALFVSLISILIAFHHGQVMQELVNQNERLVQANSLPHLQLFSSNSREQMSLAVSNAGIGPAEIRAAEVLVDAKPVGSTAELLRACCGLQAVDNLTRSSLLGVMIRPGETLKYLELRGDSPDSFAAVAALSRAYEERRLETRLCYCSVFDECWLRSSRDMRNAVRPRGVDACPVPQVQYK